MRRSIELIAIAFLFFFMLVTGKETQAQKLWSQVKLDRTSAYVGEPVQVSITVYTSTWFTSGIDPGNIKVNGAFTVYFRPVSVSILKDGQTFPGVQLIYHVFPFDEKDILFPSLTLEVESPPEGDFKGVKHKMNTVERRIRVKPIPPGFDKSQWLVANNLSVNDQWVGSLKNVKVGDVLERRISRTAYNTVSELIPPVVWDSLPNVSLYPTRSSVENHKSPTSISASRVESMRYLFEKEGTVTVPEIVFNWYNPYQRKLYKRTLKEVTIEVQPNPNLGVLASIRDSLRAEQIKRETLAEGKDKPFTILGYSPKIFVAIVVLTIGLLYLFFLVLRAFLKWAKQKREEYLGSEKYFFHLFTKSLHRSNSDEMIRSAYRWIDSLHLKEPSIQYFVNQYGVGRLPNFEIADDPIEKLIRSIAQKEWKSMRHNYLHRDTQNRKKENLWINPQHDTISPLTERLI